jgi:arylsulfatase A-like enzyme
MKRFAPGVYDPDQDRWELYYLPDDFSQAKDLAAEHPDKLEELRALWWQETEDRQAGRVRPQARDP